MIPIFSGCNVRVINDARIFVSNTLEGLQTQRKNLKKNEIFFVLQADCEGFTFAGENIMKILMKDGMIWYIIYSPLYSTYLEPV